MMEGEIPAMIQQIEYEQQLAAHEQLLAAQQRAQQEQYAALGGVAQAAAGAGALGANVSQLSFEERQRLLANARTSVSACVQLFSLHLSLAHLPALPCRARNFCPSLRFRFTSLPQRVTRRLCTRTRRRRQTQPLVLRPLDLLDNLQSGGRDTRSGGGNMIESASVDERRHSQQPSRDGYEDRMIPGRGMPRCTTGMSTS